MILNRLISVFLSCVIVLASSCQGTHGHIRDYQANCSKEKLEKTFFLIGEEESNIIFINNTDRSDINRPGYFDMEVVENGVKTIFKLSYFGNEEYWRSHSDNCIFAVIEINGKRDSDFGWFSSRKKEGLKLFEREIIPLLENKVGAIGPRPEPPKYDWKKDLKDK